MSGSTPSKRSLFETPSESSSLSSSKRANVAESSPLTTAAAERSVSSSSSGGVVETASDRPVGADSSVVSLLQQNTALLKAMLAAMQQNHTALLTAMHNNHTAMLATTQQNHTALLETIAGLPLKTVQLIRRKGLSELSAANGKTLIAMLELAAESPSIIDVMAPAVAAEFSFILNPAAPMEMEWTDQHESAPIHKKRSCAMMLDHLKLWKTDIDSASVSSSSSSSSSSSPQTYTHYLSVLPPQKLLDSAIGTGTTDVIISTNRATKNVDDVVVMFELKKPKTSTQTSAPPTPSAQTSPAPATAATSSGPSPLLVSPQLAILQTPQASSARRTPSPRASAQPAFIAEHYGQIIGQLLAANLLTEKKETDLSDTDAQPRNVRNVPAILTNLVDAFAIFYVHNQHIRCIYFYGGVAAIRVGFWCIAMSLKSPVERDQVIHQLGTVAPTYNRAIAEFLHRKPYSGMGLPEFVQYGHCEDSDDVFDEVNDTPPPPEMDVATPSSAESASSFVHVTPMNLMDTDDDAPVEVEAAKPSPSQQAATGIAGSFQ